MGKFERLIRILYVTVAFSSALAMHLSGSAAFAQTSGNDVLRPYNEETRLYNRLDKQDDRMAGMDEKISDLSGRVDLMQGIGEGGMTVLGILQAIGLLSKLKDKEKDKS